MNWFYLVCYLLFVYGISVIFTQGIGPFNVFFRLRQWADSKGANFGMLFHCMLCFPTNVGIVFSLVNWFFLPITITPFNFILGDYGYLWWLAAIMDGCVSGGVCRFIYNIEDYIDKSTPIFED